MGEIERERISKENGIGRVERVEKVKIKVGAAQGSHKRE